MTKMIEQNDRNPHYMSSKFKEGGSLENIMQNNPTYPTQALSAGVRCHGTPANSRVILTGITRDGAC